MLDALPVAQPAVSLKGTQGIDINQGKLSTRPRPFLVH